MDNRLIEQIKQRLPITEVLSTYITLEPSGTQFKARCPFHNEKTASFSVSPERGLYYCFGCGVKGDIITFVQEFEGLDFKGALKVLADRAGIVMTHEYAKAEATDNLYDALEKSATIYQEILQRTPEALAYLYNRGLTKETIEQFRIGYAPTEWRTIASSLQPSEIPFYERAGLIKPAIAKTSTTEGKTQYYDRFRGRIVFPMMDGSGRIVAFSGRMFPDTAEGPKYLNSPETEVFQKSRILFGFDKAKIAIKKHNFAILVEGQMDLVLSHQAGFKNTVATSGTAVSETTIGDSGAQLSVIARLTPNIFLAFDGDNAGQKALERAALVTLSMGMNPKVVALPEGMDPADFISQQGADPSTGSGPSSSTTEWKELLKNAEHFIPHTLHSLQQGATSAHQLRQAIRARLFPFLIRVTSTIERQVYLNTIAAESSLGIKEVTDEFNNYMASLTQAAPAVLKEQVVFGSALTHMQRFIIAVELYPDQAIQKHKETISLFRFNDEAIILPEIEESHKARAFALVEKEFSTLDEEQRLEVIAELSKTIINQFLENLRFQYAMKMNEAKQSKNEEEELQYLGLLQKINQSRHVLDN
jgi:DNA primase